MRTGPEKLRENKLRNITTARPLRIPLKPLSRRRQRTFSLQISLPPLDALAWDVVHSIERTDLCVADSKNPDCLSEKLDSDGATLVDNDATLTVPLTEWLAVGCQRIRWQEPGDCPLDDNVCAVYKSNFNTVFGHPESMSTPHGPSMFIGEIVLPLRIQNTVFTCQTNAAKSTGFAQAFQLVIAHELVHVFDTLKYLVPAFMNWRQFWTDVLAQGCRTDLLLGKMSLKTLFIDDYNGENERAQIAHWWPSRVETWWKARRWLSLFAAEDTKHTQQQQQAGRRRT